MKIHSIYPESTWQLQWNHLLCPGHLFSDGQTVSTLDFQISPEFQFANSFETAFLLRRILRKIPFRSSAGFRIKIRPDWPRRVAEVRGTVPLTVRLKLFFSAPCPDICTRLADSPVAVSWISFLDHSSQRFDFFSQRHSCSVQNSAEFRNFPLHRHTSISE